MFKFLDRFAKRDDNLQLRKKYENFRKLLSENNAVLEIMADMEEKLSGEYLFDMQYVRSNCEKLAHKVKVIIDNLNKIGNEKYKELYHVFEKINSEIQAIVNRKREIPVSDFVIPFENITKDMADIVGGKNANLGEVKNQIKLPVPDGFAITTYAYKKFMETNGLFEKIAQKTSIIDIKNQEGLHKISKEIQGLISNTNLPQDISQAIFSAYHDLVKKIGNKIMVSVRSSAICEDSESTFAGQYATVLNVSEEHILQRYKEIIASKFMPRVLFYLKSKGLNQEEIAMGVGCVVMVDAQAGGVMYSQDPNNPERNRLLIGAVWGLGKYAVDGSVSPDTYIVSKTNGHRILKQKVSCKDVMLVCGEAGVEEIKVPLDLQNKPCLTEKQIKILSYYAAKLEEYYGQPQDIEWALDKENKIYILQTRPLKFLPKRERREQKIRGIHKLLIDNGAVACRGIGYGKVYKVKSDEDLIDFPKGAVLVARNPSPKFVTIMDKASAIITDMGSTTGHMATIAREFQIPTIVDTQVATQILIPNQEVTVDAFYGKVYNSRIDELLEFKERIIKGDSLLKQTHVFETLKEVSKKIVPLSLTNPAAKSFKPKFCNTFHDITRFAHEVSIGQMFEFNVHLASSEGTAKRLVSDIPLNVYVIDLGGGLEDASNSKTIKPEQIRSIPMKALWKGMSHKGVRWAGHIPIDFKSFLSVFANTVFDPAKGERALGDKSYAIVSENYLNFNSRLGYHFSTIDAYSSNVKNENYISYRFKGGAASIDKRKRRARFIAEVLKKLDFWIDQKGDLVNATLREYDRKTIEEKLDLLGRLMGCARQLDVTMDSDERIDFYVKEFMKGNYSLGFDA